MPRHDHAQDFTQSANAEAMCGAADQFSARDQAYDSSVQAPESELLDLSTLVEEVGEIVAYTWATWRKIRLEGTDLTIQLRSCHMTIPTNRMAQADIPIERAGSVPFSLSWGAVFAGLLVALTLELVLTMAGTAIGLGAWDPSGGVGLGIGAAIWTIVSILISLYVGGATAGWVAGALTRPVGMLHGVLVWALTTLVTLWLVASGISSLAGAAFGVAGRVVGATASVAAQGASAAVGAAVSNGNVSMGDVRSQIESVLRQTGDPALNPDSLGAAAHRVGNAAANSSASNGDLVGDIVNMVQNKAGTLNRADLTNVIMARTGKSQPESERLADRIISLQQTAAAKIDTLKHTVVQKAAGAANTAASATSTGLWFALLGLGLSLAAAVLGAARTRTPVVDRHI